MSTRSTDAHGCVECGGVIEASRYERLQPATLCASCAGAVDRMIPAHTD
jgi:RNA polymerase-binding transcription factor DksA